MTVRAKLVALTLTGCVTAPAVLLAQNAAPGVQVGVLTCDVEGASNFVVGSTQTLGCNYKSADTTNPVEFYRGTVREFGLDIGTTHNARLVWGVLAPSADMKPGALAGHYAGVQAGASLGAGMQANALIGGLNRSIALNPVSLQTETGTNLTLGVARLTLEAIN